MTSVNTTTNNYADGLAAHVAMLNTRDLVCHYYEACCVPGNDDVAAVLEGAIFDRFPVDIADSIVDGIIDATYNIRCAAVAA